MQLGLLAGERQDFGLARRVFENAGQRVQDMLAVAVRVFVVGLDARFWRGRRLRAPRGGETPRRWTWTRRLGHDLRLGGLGFLRPLGLRQRLPDGVSAWVSGASGAGRHATMKPSASRRALARVMKSLSGMAQDRIDVLRPRSLVSSLRRRNSATSAFSVRRR